MDLWNALFRGDFSYAREGLEASPSTVSAYLAVKEGRFSNAMALAKQCEPADDLHRLLVLAEGGAKYGSIQESQEAAEELLHLAKEKNDRILECLAMYSLGLNNLQLSRPETALIQLYQAKNLVNAQAYPQIYGEILEAMGTALLEKGYFEKAMNTLIQARDFFLMRNNPYYLIALLQIGKTYSSVGDYKKAREIYKEVALASEDQGFTYGIFLATTSLGELHVKLGQFDLALLQFSLALRLSVQTEVKTEVIRIHQRMAEIYYYKDKYGIALALIEASIQLQKENPLLLAKSLFLKGLVLPKLMLPNSMVIEELEKIWLKNPTETIRTMYLTLKLQNRQIDEPSLNEIKHMLHSPAIPIDIRLKAIAVLIHHSLQTIENTQTVHVGSLFEIITLLDFFVEFADKQGSVFHKLVAILLKARLYLLRGEIGLAEVAIELAEALMLENELFSFQNDLENIKLLLQQDVQIKNFEHQLLEQLAIDEELTSIYKPKMEERNVPVAFLISNQHNIEILNVSFRNPEQVSPFVTGLLFAINLLQKTNMDIKISEIKLVDFSILFKTVDGITYWLIVKGKPTPDQEKRFNGIVEELRQNRWIQDQKDEMVVEIQDENKIVDLLFQTFSETINVRKTE